MSAGRKEEEEGRSEADKQAVCENAYRRRPLLCFFPLLFLTAASLHSHRIFFTPSIAV